MRAASDAQSGVRAGWDGAHLSARSLAVHSAQFLQLHDMRVRRFALQLCTLPNLSQDEKGAAEAHRGTRRESEQCLTHTDGVGGSAEQTECAPERRTSVKGIKIVGVGIQPEKALEPNPFPAT